MENRITALASAAPAPAGAADLVEADLQQRCAECIEWQKTGELRQGALQAYAEKHWSGRHDSLQMAERDTEIQAMQAVARWGTQPTSADSVLEDAARYRHIRDVPHSEEVRSVLIHQQNAVMDKVIDKDRAALAANNGDTHE